MRRLLVGLSGVCLMAAGYGCAAGEDDNNGGGGSTSTTQPSGGNGGTGFQGGNGTGGSGGFAECATFTAEANQEPAALLIVLDKSASMTTQQKWGTAQLAVVSAIDSDSFDSLSLGLVAFPSSNTSIPDCLCDYLGGPGVCEAFVPNVSCGTSVLPQVAMAEAGTLKSNEPGGVRASIYNYLATNAPLSNSDDGSPIYDAMVGGYMALKSYETTKRIMVVVTDGGFSCTSVATPFRNGYSDGACPDWEIPDTVNTLIQTQRDDPSKPVNTFFVGLPGSDSTGEMAGSFATPPYHMRLALSTYAVTGSPDTVDPGCSSEAVYTQGGVDPAVPCHIDLTTGTFSADALAAAIAKIRGQALGCVYELPEPPQGETIDPGKVNVDLTVDGTTTGLPKRADPENPCTDSGCWDYTDDGRVELIGKACEDVTNAVNGKVDIIVGCDTIIE
jgi:hypothetical protein